MVMSAAAGEGDGEKPLAGVVLCSTSIGPEQRTELERIAGDLGADYKWDLTSDVTHLVVGKLDTPKYKFVAKNRPDVKVVTARWLEVVRDVWREAEAVDVPALEVEHTVPAFADLNICISGFDNLEERNYIIDLLGNNGANYHGNLTQVVSHLVVAEPKGRKYDWARHWGVKTVALEWLTDSLKRGMVLDEALYNPLLPAEERGQGAWKKLDDVSPPARKRPRQSEQGEAKTNANRRKLRRTASSKLASQNSNLWTDITSGFNLRPEESEPGAADEEHVACPADPPTGSTTGMDKNREQTSHSATVETAVPNVKPRKVPKGIFQGRVVYVHGFDQKKASSVKTDMVYNYIEGQGAELPRKPELLASFSADEKEDGFLVVPHDVTPDDLPPTPPAAERLQRVTEWWIECCLITKQYIDPVTDPFCLPPANLRVQGFEGLVMNGTGFTGAHVMHIKKLISLMGAMYDEEFRANADVLVCNTRREDKLDFATRNSIPAVSVEWLWECIKTGNIQPFSVYLLNDIDPAQSPVNRKDSRDEVTPSEPSRPTADDSHKRLEVQPQRSRRRPTRDAHRHHRHHRQGDGFDGLDDGSMEKHTPGDRSAEPAQQPLRDLEPNVNSPKKRTQHPSFNDSNPTLDLDEPIHRHSPTPNDENLPSTHTSSTAKPTPAPPASNDKPQQPNSAHSSAAAAHNDDDSLKESITTLLAQRQVAASRPATAASAPETHRARRTRGLLGRAPSGASNPSLSGASRASQPPSADAAAAAAAGGGGLELTAGSAGMAERRVHEEFVPSQALGYEDPEVERRREAMIRRMGGEVGDGRVEGVKRGGVVRDGMAAGKADGMGLRRGRRR